MACGSPIGAITGLMSSQRLAPLARDRQPFDQDGRPGCLPVAERSRATAETARFRPLPLIGRNRSRPRRPARLTPQEGRARSTPSRLH